MKEVQLAHIEKLEALVNKQAKVISQQSARINELTASKPQVLTRPKAAVQRKKASPY